MKPLFKRLPEITHTQIFQPLKRTLLTLLFTVPQVPIQYPLLGSISSGGKALAQTTSCPVGTSPGTIEWTPTNNLQEFLNQNLSVGGINTTFSFSESSPGVIDAGETRIEPLEYGGIQGPNLRFNIGGNSLGRPPENRDNSPAPAGSSATLRITFAQPVTLASPLTLLDIDRDGQRDLGRIYQDRVTVTAFNGNTPVGVTGTAVSPNNTRVTNQGNSVLAEGINENAQTTQSNSNIQVTPAGAITQIQILYQPGEEFGSPPQQDETIGLARINICAPVPGGTLGDTVYNDTNGNSIQDTGETGISGVTVNLAGAGPDGVFGTPDDISRTTTTDANGIYSFPGLPAGSYRVSVNNPAGLIPTQTQPNAVGLGAGQTINTLDFGFTQQQGSIGDTVYNDTNGNSTQNSGETGIGGVTVTLAGAGPDGQFGTADDFSRTTTTDSNGRYSFTGLPGGNYRVTVNNPAGLTATQTQPNAIALGNGQNIDTVDFGFTQQPSGVGSIGDTVFNDTNGNGVQDQGEPGIGGVTINLRDSSGNIVTTTTTNNNGNYSFPNLPPGNYTVSVPNPPAGFTPTLVPSAISLQPGQNVDTADFGFTQQPRGTIGDTVFSDTNGNNTQEPGEPGIPGVTVLVRDSSGNTVATTNTDANGRYSVNVPPGSYTVAVTNPPFGFTPTLTQPNPINVGNGQNIDTVDFGFRPTSQGSIGDTVFQDLNGNGVQDSNDVGVSGVRVRLFGPGPDGIINTADDNQIAEQFTDGTPNIAIGGRGNYTFNNLPPGVYRVESDTPPGNPPNDTTTLTTGRNPIIVNLGANQNFLNADFGFNMTGFSGNNPGSIGDTVFNDRNNNGVQDQGEPGIPNVPLTLTLPGPDGRLDTPGDNTTQTTTTNSNGNYGFNNLPPGPYRVTITQPFDFPQITTGSPQIDVTLQSGQTLNNVDFGLRRPPGGTIGDFVFNDRNGDRTPNPGETGIPNATVTLRNSSNQIVATTTTNNNGNYIFTGLPLGNYTVDVTRPGGGLNPTTNTTLTANLTEANPDNLDIDFGFRGGTVGQANTGLRLVKRITNVFRNGQPVNITNFNTFVDDPNDNNDNILQQAGRPPLGVSQLQTALQSGDEVEYTISYLAEGDQDLQNVSFCDLIPPETSYSSGEISVNRAGTTSLLTNAQDSDQGAFFTPLQPLPQPNQCISQTNTKGAVIVNVGTITPDRNFGFLRFRVQID